MTLLARNHRTPELHRLKGPELRVLFERLGVLDNRRLALAVKIALGTG